MHYILKFSTSLKNWQSLDRDVPWRLNQQLKYLTTSISHRLDNSELVSDPT